MPVVILNKNRFTFSVKSLTRDTVHSHIHLLRPYLKTKEFLIKNISLVSASRLFKKIFIETISYCNNDCDFCSASIRSQAKSPANLMSEGLFDQIIKELSDLSFSGSVAFHCNNEPLLDKRLTVFVRKAREKLRNNFFYIYTNGTLVNVNLANQLFEAGLNRMIINNYDNRHELLSSVAEIITNKDKIKGDIIINYRRKDEVLGNRAGQSPNNCNLLRKSLNLICLRPLSEIVVGYDGVIPLCCADALWREVMGRFGNSRLQDVWFSDPFKRIRESLANGDRSCSEICRPCDALNLPSLEGLYLGVTGLKICRQ